MTGLILVSVILGFSLGFFLDNTFIQYLDNISTIALSILLLGIGIELGSNDKIWSNLKQVGWRVILIPLAVGVGSIIFAALSAILLTMPINQGAAIGAGFGWYSLSGILLAKLHSPELGALAFLTNVFRELLAILIMPLIARKVGHITTIAPGGATSMDTTLPVISKLTNPDTALLAFITGAVLSALVPILVPLFIRL